MTNKFVTTQSVYQPKRKPHHFNEKAKWIRQGKEMIIQDFITENSTGLNFYENLERLGSVKTTIDYMKSHGEEIYGDFSKAITLENLEKKRIALMNVWKQLPYDIRDQFGNNFEIFITKGGTFFEGLKQEIMERKQYEQTGNNNEAIPNQETDSGREAK